MGTLRERFFGPRPEKIQAEPAREGKIFPVGEARKLEQQKETLPSINVKNRVSWKNENINAPFGLEVGKETPLAVFLTANPEATTDKIVPLEVMPQHGRSALRSRVLFNDKQGNIYRDVDVKGAGYVETGWEYRNTPMKVSEMAPHRDRAFSNPQVKGLLDYPYALRDAQFADRMSEAGIRTDRALAIIDLEEVVADGKKVSVAEAKRTGLIPETLRPVIEVRAYGTKARVGEFRGHVTDMAHNARREAVVEDARTMVAQELGKKPEDFPLEDYYKWFAQTLGKNVGLMHAKGWYHHYLWSSDNPNNVTMDCRITDRDSVAELQNLPDDKARTKEMDHDKGNGGRVVADLVRVMSRDTLQEKYGGYSRETDQKITDLFASLQDEYERSYYQFSGREPWYSKIEMIRGSQ